MVDAFGAITWWGFSPALDFLEVYDNEIYDESQELNFLIVGGADLRHVLKTMSRRKRHKEKTINFYLVENNLEVLARQLILLAVVLESPSKLGYQEKVHLFLELFGNSLVRLQTTEYLQMKSTEFIKLVTDPGYQEQCAPFLHLSNLKFKERDQLEAIFKFWRNPEHGLFDIRKYWEARVRHHLGIRYDSRQNVYDWDYSMKLKQKASIVSFSEYASWRETGLAFEMREDSAYEFPNRTLASGIIMKKEGERIARRGYWGDIINSPYLSFGIESEEVSLFQKSNEVHTKRSTDVAEYNITAMIHELLHGEKYQRQKVSSGALTEIQEEELSDTHDEKDKSENTSKDLESDLLKIEDVQIHLLPLNSVTDLPRKSKYKQCFDLAYFSNSMVHYVTSDLKGIFRDDAKLILETTKFMLDLKEEISGEFASKISSMAQTAGFKAVKKCNPETDSFLVCDKIS